MSYLNHYFQQVPEQERSSAAIAYLAALDALPPEIAQSIVQELRDQRKSLKLIASENYASLPVQLAMGNLLTDKYSEGYVGHRFYAGCENVDAVEGLAEARVKELFGAEHAYVQPHSGADANLVAFWAVLVHRIQSKEVEKLGKKNLNQLTAEEYERVRQLLVNQKVMGMGLGSGGHLTHGYRHNISSKMMRSVAYEVDPQTGLLDYAALQRRVDEERPLILIAGYSSYSRRLDFAKFREIADRVGAVLLVDMAHFAGLVAGGAYDNPVPYADIVTSTTHKTLRGPRGGFVLCKKEWREVIDKGCPLVLGGPLPHVMAAKAIAFQEALQPEFRGYAKKVVDNSRALAAALVEQGMSVVSGGTDNHLLVIDVEKSFRMTGLKAEELLRQAGMTVNRNAIPNDTHGPWHTSGVRLGTPALTTLGMGSDEMREIASIAVKLLSTADVAAARRRVEQVLQGFPLYPELIID